VTDQRVIQIEWSDVKRRFIDSVRHGKRWGQAHQRTLRELHANPYAASDWHGGSGAQTLEWLDHGYFAPELQAATEVVPETTRVRAGWSEEDGDIDVGRLYGGYDDFYLEVSPSDTKPGLTLTADVFFAALVHQSTVKAYGAWLAGLISTLETRGYDLEVGLRTPVERLYSGKAKTEPVEITVKRSGELSDFTEWSALFAPTGLRHLVFTAFGVASEKVGRSQTEHMASASRKPQWRVTYDATENRLHVSVNQIQGGRDAFPADLMNAQLADCGLI
jgi:hypothetical protein